MAKSRLSTLFTRTLGLNTVDDPSTSIYDEDTGIRDLTAAVNVSIDNTGRVSRRKGRNKVVSGEFHSLWSTSTDSYVVEETPSWGSIMRVGTDLQVYGVQSGLSKNKRMSFLDWNGDTLYSNTVNNGIIVNGVSAAWPVGTYEGPKTTRQFDKAPVGSHLEKHQGRVVIAVDDALYFSEPYAPGLFNLKLFWPMESRILMVKSVDTGLFVSDELKTYFLSGTSPLDFIQTEEASYPAHEWSVAHDEVELVDIGLGESEETGVIWSSEEGVCIGLPNGKIKKVTKRRMEYLKTYNKGASLLCGYHVINTMY